jgi:DNA-binding MarR family transcriptional regulator
MERPGRFRTDLFGRLYMEPLGHLVTVPPKGVIRWPIFGMRLLERWMAQHIQWRLALEGQTLNTYFALVAVVECPGLSQQALCERAGIARSDMVRISEDLLSRGHLVRTRDPADQRRYKLNVTPLGRSSMDRCETVLAEVTDEIFVMLSPGERETLHLLTLRALGFPTPAFVHGPDEV